MHGRSPSSFFLADSREVSGPSGQRTEDQGGRARYGRVTHAEPKPSVRLKASPTPPAGPIDSTTANDHFLHAETGVADTVNEDRVEQTGQQPVER